MTRIRLPVSRRKCQKSLPMLWYQCYNLITANEKDAIMRLGLCGGILLGNGGVKKEGRRKGRGEGKAASGVRNNGVEEAKERRQMGFTFYEGSQCAAMGI